MGTFTPELIFGEYAYGTMTETPNISYKTLLYNGFSPLSLFAASEPGFWYDPSDLSTLFQDAAGTTPVTAAGQSVARINDKSGRGNHATQSTSLSRPTYGIEPVGGRRNLLTYTEQFDNVAWTLFNPSGSASLTGSTFTFGANALDRVTQTSAPLLSGSCVVSVTLSGVGSVRLFLVGSDGSTGTPEVITLTSTPTRYSVARVLSAGAGNGGIGIYNNAGGSPSTVTVYQPQLETGPTATAYQRVTDQWNVTEAGKASVSYLAFDGSDDFLVTPTITPGTDKAQVFAGVRKLSDAASGIVAELSASGSNGSISVFAPLSAAANYEWRSHGTIVARATSGSTFVAPITNVLTGIGDIANDVATLRANGTQVATSAVDQGTGNYLAYPAYIGRRGDTANPFNGRIYSLICRFGPNLTADQITQTEAWVNSKTGAY